MNPPAGGDGGGAGAGEWFDAPDSGWGGRGLRFRCTMCGNCCSGPAGFVLFTPEEAAAIAARLGITVERFIADYTHDTPAGRSLGEVRTSAGLDCVFLDRATVPGRAVCSIYEDRPAQCRTWPFWRSNVSSPEAWARASARCPGINRGALVPPEQVRVLRDRVER